MALNLVKAGTDDLAYLLQLRKTSMGEHFARAGLFLSEEDHLFRLQDGFEYCFIIVRNRAAVGMIKYQVLEDKIDIMQVQISPEFQGQGIGKTILQQLLSDAERDGKKVMLSVLKQNPAQNLYHKLGFKTVGEDEDEFYMEWAGSL
jgi:ribosomal protein S18 acetylase RimI-like enzyme|tara:strand:- start:173 stop:610 length:438 start_codon:yes stop_codon:yes gene_type:complete